MQQRETTKVTVEPDGPQQLGPIMQFKIEVTVTREARRSDREIWRLDTDANPPVDRHTAVTGLTRDDLVKLISDAADILAYIETYVEEGQHGQRP